jgi:hypothetical protein
MARSTQDNSWEGVQRLAAAAGATYPELVAAQWALESGWGKAAPGHNYFGLKGAKGEGQLLDTTEVVAGEVVQQQDFFLTFSGIQQSIEYLVDRWYKDWKQHKGVNRASSREAAARELQKQGYATNPAYASKLIALMKQHAVETRVNQDEAPVLLRLKAKQATVLKKEPKQVTELGEKEQVKVVAGRVYEVLLLKELAADAHDWVKLGHGAGNWFIWGPHWERVLQTAKLPESGSLQLNWGDFGCPVTKNLSVGEVIQWDKRRVPKTGGAIEHRILETAKQFQRIRDAWGQPLVVTSFYRPEPINQQVGGVSGSRHVSGEAFDCYPANGDLERFYQWARARWTGGFGDGRPRGFLHFDTRSGGHFVPGAGVRPVTEWVY